MLTGTALRPLPRYIIPALLVGFWDIVWISLIIWLFVAFRSEPPLTERLLLGMAFYAACSILYACALMAALALKAMNGTLELSEPRTWKEKFALVSYISWL